MSTQMGATCSPLVKFTNNKVCRCKHCRGKGALAGLKRMERRSAKRKDLQHAMALLDETTHEAVEAEQKRLQADYDYHYYEIVVERYDDDERHDDEDVWNAPEPTDALMRLYKPNTVVWDQTRKGRWNMCIQKERYEGHWIVGDIQIIDYAHWRVTVQTFNDDGYLQEEVFHFPYMEQSLEALQKFAETVRRMSQ